MTPLKKLVKYYNETEDIAKFIEKVIYEFEPKINKLVNYKNEELSKRTFNDIENPNRSLFSEETTKKILSHIGESAVLSANENEN